MKVVISRKEYLKVTNELLNKRVLNLINREEYIMELKEIVSKSIVPDSDLEIKQ